MRKKVIESVVVVGIPFVVGVSAGLMVGFCVAWGLCLKLLSILVLIPLGPGGW